MIEVDVNIDEMQIKESYSIGCKNDQKEREREWSIYQ